MFGKSEIEFEARIKVGAAISHDFGYFSWPDCKAPGGGHEAKDPNMVFEASLLGNHFSLKAPGYGGKPEYGNGSIALYDINQLIVSDDDRERVLAHFRAKKKAEIEKASSDLERLQGELSALS